MPLFKKKKNPSKSKARAVKPKRDTGWFNGQRETFDDVFIFFNEIEKKGFVVTDVDVEYDAFNNIWHLGYKVSKA